MIQVFAEKKNVLHRALYNVQISCKDVVTNCKELKKILCPIKFRLNEFAYAHNKRPAIQYKCVEVASVFGNVGNIFLCVKKNVAAILVSKRVRD